jgi:hypothetical protein
MSDPEPYKQHLPGDIITAQDWNEIQIKTRKDIQEHDHRGGETGVQLTSEAIHEAELTLQSVTLEGGFIKGSNPLFDKSEAERDGEAVAVLGNEKAGTFLIAGPRKDDPVSFCIYWKTGNEGKPYMRFDSNQLASMGSTITALDKEGKAI